MSRKTRRELEQELDRLKRTTDTTDGPTTVTVDWRTPTSPRRPTTRSTTTPETATLTYDLWAVQRDCLDALESGTNDIVAFLGATGAGRASSGARWLLAQALPHPGSRFLAMGQTFTKARGATFRKLFAQLPGARTATDPARSPIVADYRKTEGQLVLTNGSVIVLGSADSWSRYAGDEFGAIWLDEPSHYEPDLHDLLEMVSTRLRGVAGPKVQCWTLTGNGYNDAWEILDQRQDTTGEPLGHEIALIRASTLENPYLTPDEREGFARQYGGTSRADQALHGGFAAAEGLVYSQFDRTTHVRPHDEIRERVSGDWRVYGYDAGWNNPRVLVELGKTSYDQLVVIDVFSESNAHVEDAIAWLARNGKPDGTIYCEHAPDDVDRFRRAGYRTARAPKDLDEGIAEVRKRLEADGNLPVTEPPRTRTEVIHRSGRDTGGSRKICRPRLPSGRGTDETAADREGCVGLLVSGSSVSR